MTIRRSLAAEVDGPIEKDTKTHAARRIALDKATLAAPESHRTTAVERMPPGLMEKLAQLRTSDPGPASL